MPTEGLDLEKIKKMKVADLRKELSERDLKPQGLKPALILRLTKDIAKRRREAENKKKQEEKEAKEKAEAEKEAAAAAAAVAAAEAEKAKDAAEKAKQPKAETNGNANGNGNGVTAPTTPDGFIAKIEAKEESARTDAEKDILIRKKRAERFGSKFSLSDAEKIKIRTNRFGSATSAVAKKRSAPKGPADDPDKMAKRAKRFGGSTKASGIVDPEEAKKRAARAARFAVPEKKEE